MNLLTSVIISYFLGSIPFGLIVGKWVKNIDIREHGSKNIGATNVFRVVGKKWGIIVLILDALKGFMGVMLADLLGLVDATSQFFPIIGVSAILGHTFSIWIRFKGGKGVATSLGVFLALAPQPTLITFTLWWVIFLVGRILSIASIAAALAFPIILLLTYRNASLFGWLFPISLLLAAFILYTHRSNIIRIKNGQEKKLF